ncbi:MAG: ATP-binding protein [Defluviitaleaceae bacterium]|nr:ATP-binding protein [Defluviitaleaceae bacterium]
MGKCKISAWEFSYELIENADEGGMGKYMTYIPTNSTSNMEEERFRAVIESSPTALCITTETGEVIDCNQATLDLFQLSTKDEYRTKFPLLSPTHQPCGTPSNEKMASVVQEAITTGTAKFEWMHQTLDEKTCIPCSVVLKHAILAGKMAIIGYIRDLREQKEIQAKLEEALRKERERGNAKSRFLSNMSHEMRTPLNGIIGMTDIASNTDDVIKKDNCIDNIKIISNHLLGIVNQVLDMAKIEAGKLTLHSTPIMIRMVLLEITCILSYQIDEKALNFTLEVDDDVPSTVVIDKLRLTQVITNILNNAVKFTTKGGNISLKLARYKKEDILCIEVEDDGIGISKETESRLFEVFEQADAYTTHQFGGSGLGLPISKQIIEQMGGSIWVESELGIGSKFIFTMPYLTDTGDDIYAPLQTIVSRTYSGHTVLLAEDIEINREIITAQLEKTGLTIDYAEDGEQALQMFSLAPERYSLIFMDLSMPKMDGISATRAIRKLDMPTAKTIPIIAMTANVFPDDIDACINAGMNTHLGKPLEIERIFEVLDEFLKDK